MYSSAECLAATPRRSLSAMHRSKVTPAQSMVNLSSNSPLYGACAKYLDTSKRV